MILTGTAIHSEFESGKITIAPFKSENLNPNSYNYHLGPWLKVPKGESGDFELIDIPEEGFVLNKGCFALGHTEEKIGSTAYSMSLIGRSSLGRYGLFLQVSANLGHVTSCHQWTLELFATQTIRLYAGMRIGQVSFWENQGSIHCFGKTYANFNLPTEKVTP